MGDGKRGDASTSRCPYPWPNRGAKPESMGRATYCQASGNGLEAVHHRKGVNPLRAQHARAKLENEAEG